MCETLGSWGMKREEGAHSESPPRHLPLKNRPMVQPEKAYKNVPTSAVPNSKNTGNTQMPIHRRVGK